LSGPSVWARVVGDFVRTVLRWRDVDYRLLFGGAIVVGLLLLRLGAFGLDVDTMEIYQPRATTSGFVKSVTDVSPNCRDAPGYLLGTDRNGRSLAKTLVEATETFFDPAVLCCAIALFLGTLLGSVAGYFRGGILEESIKLVLTVVASYPRLVLVIVAVGIFTASLYDPGGSLGLRLAMIATFLGLSYVPVLAMAIYQKVGSFQREQFVEAARAHGLSHGRILGFHILWANCTPVLARHFFYLFGYFILVETSLSFLGPNYGVPSSIPSWGNLLAGCKTGSLLAAQFMAPASCIVLSILGLTLLGDAIGDHFERGRH
jgi:peptide/nickel transport system permease protein